MKFSLNLKQQFCIIVIPLTLFFSVTLAFSTELDIQKAKRYRGDEQVTDWFMSEKLDGIRGYWDGNNLLTRKGKMLHPPQWFLKHFPPFALDGELWSGESQFEFIQSTVLDKVPSDQWQQITYNIFEVPNAPGDFPARLQKAKKWFKQYPNKYVRIIPQIKCKDRKHLEQFLEGIKTKGGEGVILKNPNLDYHTGRTPHVLKLKFSEDMEGEVTFINEGNGKFLNMMGSLTLKLENGVIFKLGSGFSDALRRTPPPVGALVTFKYYGFTKNGKPKFASYLRTRKD